MSATQLFYYVAIINAALLLVTLVLLVAKITNAPFWTSTNKHLKKHAYKYAFAATLLSSLASLYLSEIAGITPCYLCWVQRAFMYPLAVFFGYKLFKKQELYAPTLGVLSAALLYIGLKILSEEFTKLYSWYALTLIFPLAVYLVFKSTPYYSDKRYGLGMASIGGLVAAYHYAVQRVGFLSKTIPCSVDASCSTMYLGYWGFYSIPLMAFVGFAAAAFALWQLKK